MTTINTSDGLALHVYEWVAEDPTAVVALIHGYGEHAGRYAHMAKAWAERGITTVAADLRGHGQSPGVRAHVDRFTDYHADAHAIVAHARSVASGKPVFMMGHSMGGLIALHVHVSGTRPDLKGLLLSSPYLGLTLEVHPLKAGLGKVMSSLIPTLGLPTGLAGADVCRDPELAKLYDTDPLNNKNATARWFTESTAAIDTVHARAASVNVPLIFLYGGDDKVASSDASDAIAAKLQMEDRTVERLAGVYHELVNEPPETRDPIIARYGDWILERAGA